MPVTEAGCIQCHDQANSPDFDYASYLRRASCQQ
jgi:predicted CXXCH cytochrome family protein